MFQILSFIIRSSSRSLIRSSSIASSRSSTSLPSSSSASLPYTPYFQLRKEELTKEGSVAELHAHECHICLENVEDPVITPCLHIMCHACIYDYLNFPKSSFIKLNKKCPVCKIALTLVDLHRVKDKIETNNKKNTKNNNKKHSNNTTN